MPPQFRRVLRRFFKQISRDAFEVVGGFFRPAQLHLAARLLFSNQLFKPRADFFMGQKLTPVGGRQSLLDFAEEPLVVIDKARDGFLGKRFRIAALFGGEAVKLGLHVGAEMYFHRLQSKDSRALSQTGRCCAPAAREGLFFVWFSCTFKQMHERPGKVAEGSVGCTASEFPRWT